VNEDEHSEFFDMVSGMAEMAAMNRAIYVGHVEAGFTEEEAMDLTKFSFRAMIATLQHPKK
jgi:hypothetical protein